MSWQWLCLSEIKSGYIGGAVGRELGGKECARSARRRARPAYPSPRIDAYGPGCTTRRRNAHGIAESELLYPWHPWAGCLVHIHEVVEKAGIEVFRCSLSGQASGRRLEIPAWMFDRAAGAAWRGGAAPYVDIAVLTALATLLQDVTSVSAAPSQLQDSSAALGSHDANRGDAHAAPAYRSSPSSQQCTPVRSVLRPALRRGAAAAMATVARRDAPYADEADGPPDLRPRRRRPRSGTGGDASSCLRRSGRTIWSARRSCMYGSPPPIRSSTIARADPCNMRCALV